MKRAKKILIGTLIALGLLYVILIIVAYLPYKTTPIEELAGKDSKFIEVNGNTVHYTKQGTGKPLILVHGFAGFTYTWRYLIPLLTDHFTVYAYDVLGFGLSDKPPDGEYDMGPHGEFLIDFMDALGITFGCSCWSLNGWDNHSLCFHCCTREGGFPGNDRARFL